MVPVGGVGEGLNTGTLTAVPQALSLKPHNLISSCMALDPFEPLSLHWSPGRVPVNEIFVHWPFNRAPGFSVVSYLTQADGIPTDFYSQMLCRLLLLALRLRAGKPGVELRLLVP